MQPNVTKDLRLSWACDAATKTRIDDLAAATGKDTSRLTREAMELFLDIESELKEAYRAASVMGLGVGEYLKRILAKQNSYYTSKIASMLRTIDLMAPTDSGDEPSSRALEPHIGGNGAKRLKSSVSK